MPTRPIKVGGCGWIYVDRTCSATLSWVSASVCVMAWSRALRSSGVSLAVICFSSASCSAIFLCRLLISSESVSPSPLHKRRSFPHR